MMTPLRSSMSKTSSDLFKTNQTSNGVYPVRTSPLTSDNSWAVVSLLDVNSKLNFKMQAEV
ncbi:MAG: hypothetical protein UX30_C0007G0034 [Candidatus Saccharibacteria bacterium GW2011_GWA2_46_10]|nr:MAG: hypothetical protein UX30_C0007G0034 [Candidatus Saccharibacteria bacterium GW2011_GWA2_46_10]